MEPQTRTVICTQEKNCSACTVYVRGMLFVSNRINKRLSQTQQRQ